MNENICTDNATTIFTVLTEKDFYPPQDPRVYTSGVDDIAGGDNYVGYVEYFWETYEEEIFDV